MIQQPTGPVDDRKAQAETGPVISSRLAQAIEFAKYFLVLIGGNANAAVPYLDAKIVAAFSAAND